MHGCGYGESFPMSALRWTLGDDDAMNIIRQDFETFNWGLTFYQAADGPFKNNDIDGRY